MGHTLSAKKRERQNQKNRVRNIAKKRALKKDLKKFQKLLAENAEEAEKGLPTVQKALDRAARKGAGSVSRAENAALRSSIARFLW